MNIKALIAVAGTIIGASTLVLAEATPGRGEPQISTAIQDRLVVPEQEAAQVSDSQDYLAEVRANLDLGRLDHAELLIKRAMTTAGDLDEWLDLYAIWLHCQHRLIQRDLDEESLGLAVSRLEHISEPFQNELIDTWNSALNSDVPVDRLVELQSTLKQIREAFEKRVEEIARKHLNTAESLISESRTKYWWIIPDSWDREVLRDAMAQLLWIEQNLELMTDQLRGEYFATIGSIKKHVPDSKWDQFKATAGFVSNKEGS